MPRRDDYDNQDDRDEGWYDDEHPRPERGSRRSDDRNQGYDDYENAPSRGPRERVSLPAIFLMIVGGLGIGMAAISLVIVATGMDGPNPFANPQQQQDPAFQAGQKVGKVLAPIVRIIW